MIAPPVPTSRADFAASARTRPLIRRWHSRRNGSFVRQSDRPRHAPPAPARSSVLIRHKMSGGRVDSRLGKDCPPPSDGFEFSPLCRLQYRSSFLRPYGREFGRARLWPLRDCGRAAGFWRFAAVPKVARISSVVGIVAILPEQKTRGGFDPFNYSNHRNPGQIAFKLPRLASFPQIRGGTGLQRSAIFVAGTVPRLGDIVAKLLRNRRRARHGPRPHLDCSWIARPMAIGSNPTWL